MENDLIKTVRNAIEYWWFSLLIGILAIILGVLFIAKPFSALMTLAILFIVGFIVSGLLEIIFAISNRERLNGWGWTLASGIIALFLGIALAASSPIITTEIMSYFVGFWIMFQSFYSVGTACDLERQNVKGWGWILALAIIGILFSFIFIISPAFGDTFIVIFASISFIIYGFTRIFISIQLKSLKNNIEQNSIN